MLQVSEKMFMANEEQRLESFACLIRDCGITKYELAKGTRVKYDTLLKALRRKPIRPDIEARIRYYIKLKQDGNSEN